MANIKGTHLTGFCPALNELTALETSVDSVKHFTTSGESLAQFSAGEMTRYSRHGIGRSGYMEHESSSRDGLSFARNAPEQKECAPAALELPFWWREYKKNGLVCQRNNGHKIWCGMLVIMKATERGGPPYG